MARPRRPALRRPAAMALDASACIECGVCDELVPRLRDRPGWIAITPATLEAMAACPVGALHWLEGEKPHGDEYREDT